jgi:defect-in-organelle-trafficking protein DotB
MTKVDRDASDYFLVKNESQQLPIFITPGFSQSDFDNLIWTASKMGASDISIQSDDYVVFMLSGIQTRASSRTIQQFEIESIATILYGGNAVAMLSQGEAIDPRYEIRPARGERIGFRCNMIPARIDGNDSGISITMRVLPKNPPHVNDLLVPAEIVRNSLPRNGLVVIAGVTSSGKSTLIASILRMAVEDKTDPRKIATYESPIEYVFDGIPTLAPKISQTPVGGNSGGLKSWSEAVESAMRRALSILLIGECRDGKTIDGCISMALTGHCTLTTVHADTVGVAFRRMVAMAAQEGGGNESVSERLLGSLSMVVVQTLCPKIGGGRIALREWLVLSRTLQNKLFALDFSKIALEMQAEVYKNGTSMAHSAYKAYRDGNITLSNACAFSGMSEDELFSLHINDSVFVIL